MDPISITTAIVALSGAIIQVGIAVEAASSGWKEAEKEIQQARSEHQTMKAILSYITTFQAHIRTEQSPDEKPKALRLLQAMEPLRALIVDTEAAFPVGSKMPQVQKKLQWIIKGRARKEKLLARLNTLWNLIHFPMEIEAINLNQAMRKSLCGIEEKQRKTHDDLLLLRRDIKLLYGPASHLVPPQPYTSSTVPAAHSSKTSKWLLTPGVMLIYCRSSTQTRRRYSFFFGVVLPRSKVILFHWRGSHGFDMHLKFQNVIPVASKIVEACRKGDVATVQELLIERKASPNDITDTNLTLLTFAIDARSFETVQLLLDNKADPNMTFGRWQTQVYSLPESPLQVAFQTRQPHIARKLIQNGADIDYISGRGWSILTYLWGLGRTSPSVPTTNTLEFYEMCFSLGPFPALHTRDSEGWTCLHRAAAYGNCDDVTAFLDRGASPYTHTRGHARNAIHIAAAFDNLDTLCVLAHRVSTGFLLSPDANGWTALHLAAERGAVRTMRYLLLHGADPRARSNRCASWFPVGLEEKALSIEELVRDRGEEYIAKFLMALRDTGWCISIADKQDAYCRPRSGGMDKNIAIDREHVSTYLAALQESGARPTVMDDTIFWDFEEDHGG